MSSTFSLSCYYDIGINGTIVGRPMMAILIETMDRSFEKIRFVPIMDATNYSLMNTSGWDRFTRGTGPHASVRSTPLFLSLRPRRFDSDELPPPSILTL